MENLPSTTPIANEQRPADASAANWVDKYAPSSAKPYLRLMRADRPVGVWLLFIPCLWGASLALATGETTLFTTLKHAALFAVGAFVMRSAGCAYNDIIDKDIDAKVARTALRPIPAGQITLKQAWTSLILLSFVGFIVLIQFNWVTIAVGMASLGLVGAYPFMKRITWWPQAWLGLTFNWGALVGFSAAADRVSLPAMLIYCAGVSWTLGYDTVYAHQDKEDDALIGVKSSARALGDKTRPALAGFYGVCVLLFLIIGALINAHPAYYVSLIPAGMHFIWQVRQFDDADNAGLLKIFKSNKIAGLLLLLPLLVPLVLDGIAANA